MPIHDWTRVEPGIFHAFHVAWIAELQRALNDGLLPSEYYALAEQIAGRLGPDVLALERPMAPSPRGEGNGVVALESAPPRTRFRVSSPDPYTTKAKRVAIRHVSGHEVVALIEVVSPGNKNNCHGLRAFLGKIDEALAGGVHLLILDLFPPGPRDPEGLHPLIWGDTSTALDPDGEPFAPLADKPLSLMAYVAAPRREAYVEPVAVGDELPAMPLFLEPDGYVNAPLAPTYDAAWRALPAYWRDVLTAPT